MRFDLTYIKPKDIEKSFLTIKENDFHYFLGANCYQHAIGYPYPIIATREYRDERWVAYTTLVPGWVARQGLTCTAYRNAIVKGCHEDGAIDIGRNFQFLNGYRTLALFFDTKAGYNDFHFVLANKPSDYEAKTPRRSIGKASNYRPLSGDYELNRYFLFPNGHVPSSIRRMNLKPFRFGARGEQICMAMSDRTCAIMEERKIVSYDCMLNVSQNSVFAREEGISLVAAIPERFRSVIKPFGETGRHTADYRPA